MQTSYNNAMMRNSTRLNAMIALTLILSTVLHVQPASAQAGTPAELISTVNALRQSLGLEPYTVDSYLMGFAQTHSDYMASLGRWTHTRADGTTSFDYGIKENVAMGTNMNVQQCVYTIWSDWVHYQTMTAYATGKVGAGVAVADGVVYYTLNVLPGESAPSQPVAAGNPGENTAQIAQNQPVIISQIVTATPGEDGAIIHTVQYGETLWTISEAYEVPIDQILTHSGLSQGTTQLFVGQELVILPASDPTATPSPTNTPFPGTPTPTQPRPTMTPFPTRTPWPTATPTVPPTALHRTLGDSRNVGLGLVIASSLGLLVVLYLGFLKKN